MKYTRKEIIKGFEKWVAEERLTPSKFVSDSDCLKEDSESLAKYKAEALIKYINQ